MTDTFRIELGQRVRQERARRGYPNGKDFARAIGIDASGLSRLERGLRRIDSMLLRKIAEVLEMPLEQLLPHADVSTAFARQGDAADGDMDVMIQWAVSLRSDIDTVSRYVGSPDQ